MANLTVSILMKLIDKVTGPAKRISTEFTKAVAQFDKAKEKADKSFASAGNIRNAAEGVSSFARAMRAAVTAPLEVAADFEQAMSGVKAVIGDITDNEFAELRKTALDLGASTSFSASQAAEGMYFLAQGGFSAQQSMSAMAGVLDLAASSGEGLARTSDIVVGVLGGFNLKADQAGRLADVLAKASNVSAVGLNDLADTMSYSAPVANALGISLEQTAAMAGLLGNAGIKGTRAGTAMNAILQRMIAPRGDGKKMMKALGLDVIDSKTGKLRELPMIFDDLLKKTAGMGEARQAGVISKIFGAEAMPAVMTLLTQGSAKILEANKVINDSSGTAAKVAKTRLDNTKGSVEQLSGAFETLSINLGDSLLPGARNLTDVLASIVAGIAGWVKAHPTLTKILMYSAVAIAAVTTALAGLLFMLSTIVATKGLLILTGGMSGFAKLLFGPVTSAIKFTLGPLARLAVGMWSAIAPVLVAAAPFLAIAAAIAAVTLAIVELVKHWKELDVLEGFKGMWDSFKDDGAWKTFKGITDVTTLTDDMGLTGGKDEGSGPIESIKGGAMQQVSGLVKLQIDSQGRPTVKSMEAKGGIDLEADAGMSMAGP